MYGDRFFFTHKGQTGSFTKEARATLISRTLAGVICDNTGITQVPVNVFLKTDPADFIDCNQTPKIGDTAVSIEELLAFEH